MESLNRRAFLSRIGAGTVGLGLSGPELAGALQAAQNRQLGTCGPPPQKNPERQASAEAFPPLPLPAVPLRRSEPKAEPAPPLFAAKLEYGTTQDWNTDPGDLDSLMKQVRNALGLWYGWKPLHINEVVAAMKADKPLKLPALYMSGHESFAFSLEQRAALRNYLIEGGTLIGDACCGRSEFATSFRSEVKELFPDRAFDWLELDHPIYRSFYKYRTVNYRIAQNAGGLTDYEGPPQIQGMNLGLRTAILFSPFDLSCGWDAHTHPHGARLIPGDAIRLGINLTAYIAALRQQAEVQAVTRQIDGPKDKPRALFTLAQLRHQGDWNPDPNSSYQMLRLLANDSSTAVAFDLKYVDATDSQLAPYPFLYLTGFRAPGLRSEELTALRRHLQAGGFLFINNPSGYQAFDKHIREMLKSLFPDQVPTVPAADHPLWSALHDLRNGQGRDRQTAQPRPLELEGLSIRGRLVVVYSKFDTVTHLKQVSDPFGTGYDADTCRRVLGNIVAYALQH